MPVTEEQFKEVVNRLEAIAADLNHLTHGNGRPGFWAISDRVFGRKGDPNEPGLVTRVQKLEDTDREGRYLQRGIAIGMALVAADTVLGLNLAGLLRGLLPQ